MKKTVFLAVMLLMLLLLSLPTLALSAQVIDPAALLLEPGTALAVEVDTAEPYLEGFGFYLITYSARNRDDYPSDSTVFHMLNEHERGSVVLLVRKTSSAYYYDIYLYDDADSIFSDYQVDMVLDDPEVYDNLKAGNIKEGATRFFTLTAEVIADHEMLHPIPAIIFGLVAAVLVGVGAVLGVFFAYRKKTHGETYPLDRYARLQLTEQTDRFVGSFVTRVKIQASSSGGGRSRGGGGFSGGRRGGR